MASIRRALNSGDHASPGFDLAGDAGALDRLVAALDEPDPAFEIVVP